MSIWFNLHAAALCDSLRRLGASPLATLLSFAMLLRYSFDQAKRNGYGDKQINE